MHDKNKELNAADVKHLGWIYARMVKVHNEDEYVDYMAKFKAILKHHRHLTFEAPAEPQKDCAPVDFESLKKETFKAVLCKDTGEWIDVASIHNAAIDASAKLYSERCGDE